MASKRKKFDLAALQDAFKSKEKKEGGESGADGESPWLPFYKLDTGGSVVVRFMPDKDTSNPRLFTLETSQHRLEVSEGEFRYVPCKKNYGEKCQACDISRALYAEKNDQLGKKFYRSTSYLAQVLVVDNGMGEELVGQLKYVKLSKQVFNVVRDFITDPELDVNPLDFDEGIDFRIRKLDKAGWANYESSGFLRKSRAMTDEEVAVYEEKGVELSSLVRDRPDEVEFRSVLDSAIEYAGLDVDDMEDAA